MKSIRVLLAAAAAASAFAAHAEGSIAGQDRANPVVTSGKTRAQVQAEFIKSRAEVAAVTGEDSGSFAQRK